MDSGERGYDVPISFRADHFDLAACGDVLAFSDYVEALAADLRGSRGAKIGERNPRPADEVVTHRGRDEARGGKGGVLEK